MRVRTAHDQGAAVGAGGNAVAEPFAAFFPAAQRFLFVQRASGRGMCVGMGDERAASRQQRGKDQLVRSWAHEQRR